MAYLIPAPPETLTVALAEDRRGPPRICRLHISVWNSLPMEFRKTYDDAHRLVYIDKRWQWVELQK